MHLEGRQKNRNTYLLRSVWFAHGEKLVCHLLVVKVRNSCPCTGTINLQEAYDDGSRNVLREKACHKEARSGHMAIVDGTAMSNKQLQDLFQLDNNDRQTCDRVRLFYEAAIKAITKLCHMGRYGQTIELDWPALLKEFTEDGGPEAWDKDSVVQHFRDLLDVDPDGLDFFYEGKEEEDAPLDLDAYHGDAYLERLYGSWIEL